MQPVYQAFWLLPDGRIQPVRTTHIQEVINCPEEFGETLGSIKNLYDVSKERMPHEGNARVEIMKRILLRGYVRIRQKRNHWMIELYKLSPMENKLISNWVNYVWDSLNDQHSDMKINTLEDYGSIIVPIREFHHI